MGWHHSGREAFMHLMLLLLVLNCQLVLAAEREKAVVTDAASSKVRPAAKDLDTSSASITRLVNRVLSPITKLLPGGDDDYDYDEDEDYDYMPPPPMPMPMPPPRPWYAGQEDRRRGYSVSPPPMSYQRPMSPPRMPYAPRAPPPMSRPRPPIRGDHRIPRSRLMRRPPPSPSSMSPRNDFYRRRSYQQRPHHTPSYSSYNRNPYTRYSDYRRSSSSSEWTSPEYEEETEEKEYISYDSNDRHYGSQHEDEGEDVPRHHFISDRRLDVEGFHEEDSDYRTHNSRKEYRRLEDRDHTSSRRIEDRDRRRPDIGGRHHDEAASWPRSPYWRDEKPEHHREEKPSYGGWPEENTYRTAEKYRLYKDRQYEPEQISREEYYANEYSNVPEQPAEQGFTVNYRDRTYYPSYREEYRAPVVSDRRQDEGSYVPSYYESGSSSVYSNYEEPDGPESRRSSVEDDGQADDLSAAANDKDKQSGRDVSSGSYAKSGNPRPNLNCICRCDCCECCPCDPNDKLVYIDKKK